MGEPVETLETIEALYHAAVEPALWPQALRRFGFASGGFGTAMIPITPGNTAGLVVSPELLESKPDYDREWWRYDTRVLRIHRRGLTDGVCCEAELFTPDEVARDPMRQEFCRLYGMGSFAAQLVTPVPDFVVAFSVMRALDRGEFEQRELDRLRLLGKHAARALVVSTCLAGTRTVEQGLAEALARVACAAWIVDNQAKVILANAAAERLIGDGLALASGRLQAQSRDHQPALARLLRSAFEPGTDVGALETVVLPRPGGKRPLLMQAIPVSRDAAGMNLPARATAIVIAVDPERQDRDDPLDALRLLGLAPAEARLAAIIGAGHSRAEAAGMLGISVTTVSDTIKHIYRKLDLSRQSELVRLVERLSRLRSRGGPT